MVRYYEYNVVSHSHIPLFNFRTVRREKERGREEKRGEKKKGERRKKGREEKRERKKKGRERKRGEKEKEKGE